MQTPIVIHNDGSCIRAGLSSGDTPSVVFDPGSLFGETSGAEKQSPIVAGIIDDWEKMKKVWSHIFKELDVDPKQHPVIISEPPLNPKACRERTTGIFFDTFDVPSFYIVSDAALALYGSGASSGIVLNVSGDIAHSAPVYEGYVMPHAIFSLPTGFSDEQISKMGKLVFDSVIRCDVDIRQSLFDNVIIAGTGSKFPGLEASMRTEVETLAPANMTVKVTQPAEPECLSWKGGDRLASLMTEYGSWISKEEYARYGAKVVHHKCF